MAGKFKFSFGPWNNNEGEDPLSPMVCNSFIFRDKLAQFKKFGYDGIQLYDEDAIPNMNNLTPQQIYKKAKDLKQVLDDHGLVAEFVASRLKQDERTNVKKYTSNDTSYRKNTNDSYKRTLDIANALGTDLVVLCQAREETYIRELIYNTVATERIVNAINQMLDYDPKIRVCIKPKQNQTKDLAYNIQGTANVIILSLLCVDPMRIGVNIESTHAILSGLDPFDELGFALSFNKLWTVHLNVQNELKCGQHKSLGSIDIRRVFSQIRILDKNDYGMNGEWVGLDVNARRTQKVDVATMHFNNSKAIFLKLLEISRSLDDEFIEKSSKEEDYEELDFYILNSLIPDFAIANM
jgi:xylose isomerase